MPGSKQTGQHNLNEALEAYSRFNSKSQKDQLSKGYRLSPIPLISISKPSSLNRAFVAPRRSEAIPAAAFPRWHSHHFLG